MCQNTAHLPYDHSTSYFNDHLKQANSNSLRNFHSFKSCPAHLVTTRISHFLLYSKFLIHRITSKFHVYQSVVTSSVYSHFYHTSIFKTPLLLSPTSDSIPPVEELKRSFHPEIRQGSLKITTLPHSLDNTRRACLKNGQRLTQKHFMRSSFKNWCFWFPYILNF